MNSLGDYPVVVYPVFLKRELTNAAEYNRPMHLPENFLSCQTNRCKVYQPFLKITKRLGPLDPEILALDSNNATPKYSQNVFDSHWLSPYH